MTLHLVNRQRRDPVPLTTLTRLARCAVHRLGIQLNRGPVVITFLDRTTMRQVNRRFTRRNHLTDVLSFRYAHEPIAGEILIAPAAARLYAKQHRVSYRRELARYVIHGLLHWLGHEDQTPRPFDSGPGLGRGAPQQRRIRALENRLLDTCGHSQSNRGRGQETRGRGLKRTRAPR